MKTQIMRNASYLLPPPGGEVVRDLLDSYDALLARHNALRESIHKAMDRTADCDKKQTDDQLIADVAYLKRLASDYFKTSVDCGNRAFAAEQKYNALRDAASPVVDDWTENRGTALDTSTDKEVGFVIATFETLDALAALVWEE